MGATEVTVSGAVEAALVGSADGGCRVIVDLGALPDVLDQIGVLRLVVTPSSGADIEIIARRAALSG